MDQDSKDANSLLVELDRGLQSQNIGDQSESVARFTNLFQRYPLPIVIDSACLKLSEAFKFCSNFIRLQICEVLDRNQSHLNKIYNIDLFYRNLFTVTTSNDPIARSITLLALSKIAPIVSDLKTIHHCISDSLESSYDCELNTAITCAASYVKQSAEFACNIYPKIVNIIDSNKSSNDIKLKALTVLDHGFYNANDAMTVRSFLISVIQQSKLIKLTCSCMSLSTKIAFSSLTHIKPQIELLLRIFLDESRLAVKMNALRNLKFLAEKSPHIWETSHTLPLITYLESSLDSSQGRRDDRCLHTILSIFCKLLTCKCNFISSQEKSRVFKQSYKLALDDYNVPLCSMAFELLAVMSEEHSYSQECGSMTNPNDQSLDTFSAIKSFITHSSNTMELTQYKQDGPFNVICSSTVQQSKSIFRQIVKLCSLNPSYSSDLFELCFHKLTDRQIDLKHLSHFITELMCAIHSYHPKVIVSSDGIWELLKTRAHEMSDKNLLNISVLYFQTLRLACESQIPTNLVEKLTSDYGLWFRFKVMRQAMRYGHYKIAGLICQDIHDEVSSDTMDFYFKSLSRICAAESILSTENDLDANLKSAVPIYEQAVSPLRASVCNSRLTNFQLEFLWLRIRTLQVHVVLRQCCKIHSLAPITYATLLSSIGAIRGGPDLGLSRLGIVRQMPKIAKDFRQLSECYDNLSQVSFDCDNQTLDYIALMKSSCTLMADAIDAVFQYGKNLPILSVIPKISEGDKLVLEHRELEATCNKLMRLIKSEIVEPGLKPDDQVIDPLMNLLKEFSDDLLKCPFMYPRYFFQSLQRTQIKLAITPQPTTSSGSITLLLNYNLVLKVEGLVQNLSKTQMVIRKVSKVLISVNLSPVKQSDLNCNLFVQSVASPHNNYFKTEFLLPLRWAGSFQVDIDVSIIDEQERTWKTGPVEKLNLNVS